MNVIDWITAIVCGSLTGFGMGSLAVIAIRGRK